MSSSGGAIDNLPPHLLRKLEQLKADYQEGLITDKGYAKKYGEIINQQQPDRLLSTPTTNRLSTLLPASSPRNTLMPTRSNTTLSTNVNASVVSGGGTSFSSSSSNRYHHTNAVSFGESANGFNNLNSQNKYNYESPITYGKPSYGNDAYIDYGDTAPYPGGNPSQPVYSEQGLPSLQVLEPSEMVSPPQIQRKLQLPLTPRDLSSINTVEKFDSLPLLLRQRSRAYAKDIAIITVSLKGKETRSISWDKLYLKAEKIAQQITKKSGLYKGDRVTLIYQDFEVVEFAIAFFGCLLAGVVAIPISNELTIKDIIQVMEKTQSHLCLTSDSVYKNFEKMNNDSATKIDWPKGVVFWKTEDMGTYQLSKKHDPPALNLPDLAYIEFSKYPIELKGVVLSHKTIMHQMNNLTRIISSLPNFGTSIFRPENVYRVRRDSILCSSDIRCSSGLVMGLLFTIYTGTMLVWTPTAQMDVPGLYANLITKYRTTILLSDLLGLKSVAFNYQADPASTRKFDKKRNVDLSCVKWCLVNCLTVNNEVLEIVADRWLKPLGCEHAREAIAPALSLSEYGGMVVSIRDWLGKEENLSANFTDNAVDDDNEPYSSSDLSEVLIDKESLSTNTVKVMSDRPPSQSANFDSKLYNKYIRVGAFGFPLLDATVAVVNPETCVLSTEMEVGEIWVDSPCLSGGYWDADNDTNNIFHARCQGQDGYLQPEFLRTGLLGFIYYGKVYVLGLYEDRFRQRVTWIDKKEKKQLQEIQEENEDGDDDNDDGEPNASSPLEVFDNGYRYYYSDHISSTIFKRVSQVECTAFDIFINGEYVPIVIIETSLAAKRIPSNTVDYNGLDALASEVFSVLEKVHKVRLFCCGFTTIKGLPRAIKSGRTEIANMLCKTKFLQGNLKVSYFKFNIKSSLSNIPCGVDVLGGIWSPFASALRRNSIPENVDRQYTGVDNRVESIDERSHARLSDFKTIVDVLKWRVMNQPDSLAFAVINDQKKDVSWKRFDEKVACLCQYILDKTFLKPGDYVILMYNLSDEYIYALYACFMLGLVPIPMMPIDMKRVDEDTGAYHKIIKDFGVRMVFTNNEIESMVFKNKAVTHALKLLFGSKKPIVVKSTTKVKHVKNMSDLRSRITSNQAKFDFRSADTTVMVCLDWTPDGIRTGVKFTHKVLMDLCKILKETFKMSSFNSILSSVRHVTGIGLVQSALLGVYLGCSTYLFSPSTYYFSPMTFFNALANYKIKDTFVTPAMLNHAMSKSKASKTFQLDKLQNMMVGHGGRPDIGLIGRVKNYMEATKLQRSSINTIYTHRFSPIITARSYLNLEPVDLWLDTNSLRRGCVKAVDPLSAPNALHLQDSGVVLCCTQIAIVNPETKQVCKAGEFGEIWVFSEGNAVGYTNGKGKSENNGFLASQFRGKLEEFDFEYLRTGDLGFIHTVNQPSIDGTPLDVQLLYVLGNISETFEVMGLQHFASDIEQTVENSHPEIYNDASLVFKSQEYTVVICCAKRKDFLASLAPTIFKSVLNNHQLMVDIVAFLPFNDFEFSRFYEKKRATMINKWNNNKLKFLNVYGVNCGENSVINTVREIEGVEEVSVLSDLNNNDVFSIPLSAVSSIPLTAVSSNVSEKSGVEK